MGKEYIKFEGISDLNYEEDNIFFWYNQMKINIFYMTQFLKRKNLKIMKILNVQKKKQLNLIFLLLIWKLKI